MSLTACYLFLGNISIAILPFLVLFILFEVRVTELEADSSSGLSNILLRDNIICYFFKVLICLYIQN